MELVVVLVAVAVLGLAAVAAAGGLGAMRPAVRDVYAPPLPTEGPIRGDDLEGVRFGVGTLGYDMAEVDDVMARMAREIDERDRALAELRGSTAGQVTDAWPGPAPVDEPGPEPADDRPIATQRAEAWKGRTTDEDDVEEMPEELAGAHPAHDEDAETDDQDEWAAYRP